MRSGFVLSLLLCGFALAPPASAVSPSCGGVASGHTGSDIYVLYCNPESHGSGCTNSPGVNSCYRSNSDLKTVYVADESPGGTLLVSANKQTSDYCVDYFYYGSGPSTYQLQCYSEQLVTANVYLVTFVPFVGPVNQAAFVEYKTVHGTYDSWNYGTGSQTHSEYCYSYAYVSQTMIGSSTTPLTNDCTVMLPPLP